MTVKYRPSGSAASDIGTLTATSNKPPASASLTLTGGGAGKDLAVSKTATPSFTRTYSWGIRKSVDQTRQNVPAGGSATFTYTVGVIHDGGTDSGWQVAGQITVSNPNSVAFTGVNVTDAANNGGACIVTNGTNVTVPKGGSVQLSYSCTYASAPTSSSGTNTATATWTSSTYHTPDGSASGTASLSFTSPTTIKDGSVMVSDSLGGNLGAVSYTDPNPATFSYPRTFSDPPATCTGHDNTATFTTNSSGATGSASQSVTVCVGADLEVSKSATPGFTRTYTWGIAKSADPALADPGGTVAYTVTVTQTGFADSGWQAAGTITLTNPNDFFDFTGVNVTDAVSDGTVCSVTNGTNVTIAAAQSITLQYSCTWESQPAYSPTALTNMATASWDQGALSTPDASGTGTASLAFNDGSDGNPTGVNKCVTVTDSVQGQLGSDCVGTDPASKVFQYTQKLTPPASGCSTVSNTATIADTGQAASASVNNCNTGAFTPGFWRNRNGQAIITSGASTSDVCNSATWLRQYAPFQDLDSTASCSTTATYVANMTLATGLASAVKAQMLATALNVYFSDPSLGGDELSVFSAPPAPIGGLTIDLTSPSNVTTAFAGATSATVLQMLSHAASNSNVGGSVWYGADFDKTGAALTAFDEINNEAAVAP